MIVCCLVAIAADALAIFVRYETEKVPLQRLFINSRQKLARNTNDFETTYQLARLHAMAYSGVATQLNVATNDGKIVFNPPGLDNGIPGGRLAPTNAVRRRVEVEHVTNAILLYERSMQLLRRATNAAERQWLVLPLQLGYSWCLDQAGRTNDALQSYRKTLKIAWKKEVEGTFEFKQWLDDSWQQIKHGSFPSRRRGHIGPGVCFTEETIGYMLKLLDPVKDADEIAELTGMRQDLAKMGRAITPILVPLKNDAPFKDLVNPDANVEFDLDGSGLPRRWGWLTPNAAWLVFAGSSTGQLTSGLQMFGNVTFWIFWLNGYDALLSLDENGDGILEGPELDGIALWHDANSNGKSESGEVRLITEYGVKGLNCDWELHPDGFPWHRKGITFIDGGSRPTYDWIVPSKQGD
jgi:hypothetical protein